MNKNRLTFLRFGIYVSYLMIAAVFIIRISSFPSDYRNHELSSVENIENEISSIVLADPNDIAAYKDLVANNNIDLVILNGDTPVFTSVPFTTIADFNRSTNPKSVLMSSSGTLTSSGIDYQILLKVHQIPDDAYFKPFLLNQLYLLVGAVALLMVGIFIMFNTFVPSLQRIRESVNRLKHYQFDALPSEGDVILEDLHQIGSQLTDNFDAVSQKYTELEVELKVSEQRLQNSMTVARTFIHDLKTPIHYAIMKNEIALDDISDNPEAIHVLTKNILHDQSLMNRINDVLKLLATDYDAIVENREVFNLSAVTDSILQYFSKEFRLKRINMELDYDSEVLINASVVTFQLLIHNLISNLLQYAITDSTVSITLYEEDGYVTMCYRNESSPENILRMQQSEQIFNVIGNNDNRYSSGNGLFLIKDLTRMLDGTYSLDVHEAKVSTIISFPQGISI
ncbi:HAMP domain-containing histidine kinase [Erysipelothrix sp. HDW6C]|uniref:sensor histidine kinase n=1 Tax=Erysipelothrix sp. HDW6C TaxID=2714930 RepID=UPI00140A3469|nr:HAMP domain-containing sensor histidine kinase [Erysipelothrix sp. HDW6C]QIK69143.1 HAMP domain-containing histidine kinase [Erysipelothrix sp. HDW6C]